MTSAHAEQAATPQCPAHGATMQLRHGRAGDFYGCARYPECRITLPVGLPGIFCPVCQSPVVERTAKKSGKPFWPCSDRACDFVAWTKPHLCAHGAACWGDEPAAVTSAPDPATPERQDAEVPF